MRLGNLAFDWFMIERASLLSATIAIGLSAAAFAEDPLNQYNVVWTTPSQDSHGSMPLGNGDVGINAWVEPSGDLVFYVSKTDAWDENGRLCKVGRVRVKFDPPLPVADGFRQELQLRDGVIEIGAGPSRLKLWVDANSPVVRLEAESEQPVSCRAAVELWRLRERPFRKGDDSHSGRGLEESSFKPTVLPDTVVTSTEPRVVWYHRNTRSIYPLSLKTQHLEELAERFPDPLRNHTFGASLAGKGFERDGAQGLKSLEPAKRHELAVTVLAAKTETPEAWLAQLEQLEKSSASSWQEHVKWWGDFWDRSWIFVSGTPEAESVTRGYVLQRFMNACAGRGGSPIKFNGSIFTVETRPGASPETPDGDPDWRRWGGNYWFQNTRLSYWSMLKAGDFDLMDAWFKMYRDALPLSQARIEKYYQFQNAAQFPETMSEWGLPNNGDYGWDNTAPEPVSAYIRRYWNGSLELIAIMLDRHDFTKDENFARDTLLPLADALISFLDQYWPKRDANGKIVFDPAQSLETWHVAVNPMPEIAGLRSVLPRLLELPATPEQKTRWKRMLEELPPIPVKDGRLQPADSFSEQKNTENPELYAIFPYRVYGIGKPDLDLARATYESRGKRHNRGWCQDSIKAAYLGLGEEAGRLVAARAAQSIKTHRFPAMWGPNFDWTPDQTHGSNILTTLQSMLLQHDGDKIFLLPAWPKDWDCDFKLHAPHTTVIEGRVRKGKLEDMKITPESRRKDVVVVPEQPQ
jgi:hypothetical protein